MLPRLPTHVHSDLIVLLVLVTEELLVSPAVFRLAKEVPIELTFSVEITIGKILH